MILNWTNLEMDLETLRNSIPGGSRGFIPERIIFRDWFMWRNHELGFAHGHLALTGQNRGGKSALLALLLPLLDGDTTPIRLDPSLSRDRSLAFYLLGDESADPENPDAFAYAARIGYLALEFRHGSTGNYLTIGMGVNAARNHPRKIKEWWGFTVEESRIGRDFDIRSSNGNCMGRRDFEDLISVKSGRVYTEHGKYGAAVNELLMGMNPDQFKALSTMLIQARTPKIADRHGPDEVLDSLRGCLPGVSDERFEHTAEVIRNIEEHKRNLTEVDNIVDCVEALDEYLWSLSQVLVQDAANRWQSANGSLGSATRILKQARENKDTSIEELERLKLIDESRQQRLIEIDQKLKFLRKNDKSDLTIELSTAKKQLEDIQKALQRTEHRSENQLKKLSQIDEEIRGIVESFRTQTKELSTQHMRFAQQALSIHWLDYASELQEISNELLTITIDEPIEIVESLQPSLTLVDIGKELASKYEELIEHQLKVENAQEELSSVQEETKYLRNNHNEAVFAEQKAEDALDDVKADIYAELTDWQNKSLAINVPDQIINVVTSRINNLQTTPSDGAISLLDPLVTYGQEIRSQMDSQLENLAQNLFRYRLENESLEKLMNELKILGIQPNRTLFRAQSRSDSGIDIPLYKCIKFKEDIPRDTAIKIELAALESGLLDLLLVNEEASTANMDAWAVPNPLTSGQTLEDIFEPEDGVSEEVIKLLSSIGLGEGNGNHWIDINGAWQHGLARGQVSLLHDEVNLIGSDRRKMALDHRITSINATIEQNNGMINSLLAKQSDLQLSYRNIDNEINKLQQLSWQTLFDSFSEARRCRKEAGEAWRLLEAKRPQLEKALQHLQEQEGRYDEFIKLLPSAKGLNSTELSSCVEQISNLTENLFTLVSRFRGISDTIRSYRTRKADYKEGEIYLQSLDIEKSEGNVNLTEITARVNVIMEEMLRPETQELHYEIEALEIEEGVLKKQKGEDLDKNNQMLQQRAAAEATITIQEPIEKQHREVSDSRLEEFKLALLLHPGLQDYFDLFSKQGPVSAAQKLPRIVEPTLLSIEIETRRDKISDFLRRNMHTLGDYRPSKDQYTVRFQYNRMPVSCTRLHEILSETREQYKNLLAEEERKLYQRILYHGLLDELRKLVYQADEFTNNINQKLKNARAADGEILQLKLEQRSVEEVTGAAIGELLKSMDQGAIWLAEDRREILLGLIQKEVERVSSEAEMKGSMLSYFEAIRTALDYRNWYEFHLYGKKPQENSVRIRNKGFGKRSSSAKAWALVVPSVAGVACRYDAAKQADAPRIVMLDEAFAGFDSLHQKIYLSFLDELNLHWIISCPDELPYSDSLSAAMTYRVSLEGNIHVTYPILWDGNTSHETLAQIAIGLEGGEKT